MIRAVALFIAVAGAIILVDALVFTAKFGESAERAEDLARRPVDAAILPYW